MLIDDLFCKDSEFSAHFVHLQLIFMIVYELCVIWLGIEVTKLFSQKACKIAGNVVSLQKELISISDYAEKEVWSTV